MQNELTYKRMIMKKVMLTLAVALSFAGAASAQSLLGGLLGGKASNTISNIVNGLAGTVYSAPVSLNGTYTYNGVAVGLGSSEGGVLSNIGGSAVASGIESKIDAQLAKVGIKPGAMTWTFSSEDNTFTLGVMGINIPGTYKVGDGENTVTLTFGKKFQYLSMTGTLKSTSSGAEMLFQANKALAFLKKVASVVGQASSEVAAVTKLAEGYDNFKLGIKLAK